MGGFDRLLRSAVFAAWAFALTATAGRAEPIIGISFPPTSEPRYVAFTIGALKPMGVTHIRIAVSRKRRETAPGIYDWEPLDRRVTALEQAGFRIFLTIESDGRDWACGARNEYGCVYTDLDGAAAFWAAVIRRYGDRVDAAQFSNEWDTRWPGEIESFIAHQARFYATVKSIAPDLPVALGGMTMGALLYDALCLRGVRFEDVEMQLRDGRDLNLWLQREICERKGARYARQLAGLRLALAEAPYDIVDLHFYDAPTLWPDFVTALASMTDAPIYVTEFGGPHPTIEIDDPIYHARRLSTYIQAIRTLPIERAYYFKLTDDPDSYHGKSGLYDARGRPKPALDVFRAAIAE